ncbi:hypothetical protein K469DRAFT_751698 [Zopfia rhizophila CBS 207.26]|uniref:Cora-domain-containing protein n=1 Tax=Zopfia rhizophila CBS 207.26 TaxID=1314779 RepID=A0A6A6DU34_9PEZI|nr:hypothetical protein K469DRAFT_751698 [Zopfia rhizophila CBS 207.26]
MLKMDSQMLFSYGKGTFLDKLGSDETVVEVLTIHHFHAAEPVIESRPLTEPELMSWLVKSSEMPINGDKEESTGGLRLILGPAWQRITQNTDCLRFPPSHHLHNGPGDVFSKSALEKIIEELHLPEATPWLLSTHSSHFQRYCIELKGSTSPLIGFTMRKSTRGILNLDVSLSMSYNPNNGLTCGLLDGCSQSQQEFIKTQIIAHSALACHPLLLPILLTAYQRQLINTEEAKLWSLLVDVETRSGQTGAPLANPYYKSKKGKNFSIITKDALGVIQRATYSESHIKALLLGLEAVQDSILHIKTENSKSRKADMEKAGHILKERLEFISHKTKVMLGNIQFIEKRGQAQLTAVFNYIAQRDARLGRKFAQYSGQIARASKRDSSAMKSIAILTVAFLPGTFISTFFAMPLFDFSAPPGQPIIKTRFWIYWAVAVPLTLTVLAIYLTYVAYIEHKRTMEDNQQEGSEDEETSEI